MNIPKTLLTIPLLVCTTVFSACKSTPTPTPRYIPDIILGDVHTLEIAANRANCNSARPMQCLIVNDGNQAFGVSYDAILGLEPAIGTRYRIQARPHIDQKTGASTGNWELVEILSQY